MTSELDLRQLAFDRSATVAPKRARRRPLFSRYVLPGVVVFGFLAMLGWAARDRFVPTKPVTVIPVVVTRAEVQQAGTPLFQAAGWIEPRPTSVLVTAMAEGVVDRLLVVEGQAVRQGEELATLQDEDARIALGQAEAELSLKRAELVSAVASHQAAQERLKQPLHLQAALAEVESTCAKLGRELANLPFAVRTAQARLDLARQTWQRKSRVSEVVSGQALEQSKSELSAAEAAAEELAARRAGLEQEMAALARQRDALSAQLELKTEEHRRLAETKAAVSAAEAWLKQAELARDAAALRLKRMTIRSPITGRVLALHAQPGRRLMGIDASSTQDSSTVLSLYDPDLLQVRVDVRLEDVPLVQPGQPVEIETASAKEPLQGQVLSATSQANIQKNTLEVKVAITAPPLTIRPEMLVTTTFLAPQQPESESEGPDERERLLVPRQLVESSGGEASVWLADPSGVARRQSVRLGRAATEELVEVVEGVTPTDRLISGGREGLNHGDRITITGEDGAIGMTVSARRS